MKIGTWNVTSLIGKQFELIEEAKKYQLDILGISSTKRKGQGTLALNNGWQLFYSGVDPSTHAQAGVAILLNPLLADAVLEWKPINERVALIRRQLKATILTIIQVYAPNIEADYMAFLDTVLIAMESIPMKDFILFLGDFNTHVGNDSQTWNGVIGPNDDQDLNNQDRCLLDFCATSGLSILPSKETDIELEWFLCRTALMEAAAETCRTKQIGFQHGQKKTAWWNEEVRKAISEKKTAYCQWIQRQTPENWQNYRQLQDNAKKLVAEAKSKSWEDFGHQLEYNHYAANKLFWQTIRRLRKGGQKSTRSVKDSSGRLLIREEDILNRWKEYFADLYNSPSEKHTKSSELRLNESDESNDISLAEVTTAIKSLKAGKAAGVDEMRPETLKSLTSGDIRWLTRICQVVWKTGKAPADWQTAKAKQEEIKKISYNFISNDNHDDDDDDDHDNISGNQTGSSSIPISRSYKSPDINLNEKVNVWIKKNANLIHNQSFDDDDQQTTLIEGLVDEAKDYLLLSRERLNMQGSRTRSRKSIKSSEILFAAGGWCSSDAIASVEMFDSTSNEWRAVASMSKRRCGLGVGVLNNSLY
ncbi:unnamed protein product [Rotaria sp. Silwood2]|nr:unnamed protein product [Rotaria sp. Silwood2]